MEADSALPAMDAELTERERTRTLSSSLMNTTAGERVAVTGPFQ